MKKQYITGLAFGAAGMLAVFALMMYLLSTTGFLGLVIWEKSYRLYVILVGLLGVVSLGLGLFSHVKAMRIITVAYACLLTVVAIGGSIFVYSLGTRAPEALPNLRFYASSDGYLKTEKSISLAIASDAHFGAASANEEARNQIMDTVNGGGYDLFVMGGDLLDIIFDLIAEVYDIVMASGIQIIVFLSGLQNVPASLYEAADVEGCTKWEAFWMITFPLVSPLLIVNIIYTIIDFFTKMGGDLSALLDEKLLILKYDHMSAMSWIYFLVTLALIGVSALIVSKVVATDE